MAFTLETKRKQRFDFMRCLYDKTEGSEVGLVYIEEVAEEIHLPEFETEIIALYLADEGLIKVRMRHIISITHLGIDEVETVLGQPDKPTEHFPSLQAAPAKPDSSNEVRRDRDQDQDRDLRPLPSPPKPVNEPADDFAAMELKNICEAIGLDPREFTGETIAGAAPPPAAPAQSVPAAKHDLRNHISDDVRKLIEHAEAAVAQSPVSQPGDAKSPNAGTAPVTRTRVRSQRPANREAVQAPPSRESDLADVLASLNLRLLKIRLAADDMAEAQAEIATAIAQLLSPRPKPQIIALSLQTLLSILEKAPAALTGDVEASLGKLRAFLQQRNV